MGLNKSKDGLIKRWCGSYNEDKGGRFGSFHALATFKNSTPAHPSPAPTPTPTNFIINHRFTRLECAPPIISDSISPRGIRFSAVFRSS